MTGVHAKLPAAAAIAKIRRGLLHWFRGNARDLPWRASRDPYRVWVSETMLQQTRIAAVIPYFERFLKRFPTLADLAAADETDVLRLWEGLGYYRRARHLHQAVKQVVAEHSGVVPRDAAAFLLLPGVGRYTANAVLSIAYDERLPIVDANAKRVLIRLFHCDAAPASKGMEGWFWNAAAKLVPRNGAGAFNQALMELGQLVCLPKNPQCLLCPLAGVCAARKAGRAESLPEPMPSKVITEIREAAILLARRKRVLLVRRPDDAERWAGLWEFPHGELRRGETSRVAARRIALSLTGLEAGGLAELSTIRHAVTRFRITMTAWRAATTAGRFRSGFYVDHAWVKPQELEAYPLSAPQRRLAEAFRR